MKSGIEPPENIPIHVGLTLVLELVANELDRLVHRPSKAGYATEKLCLLVTYYRDRLTPQEKELLDRLDEFLNLHT